jgi:hypothetical protein
LTTASPCSGRSTRSSLGSADDPPDGGDARAIADFFSPFSPAARARYRASARDNVATPVYGADAAEGGAAAAGGGGNGGHNGGNASADEQQWAAAAAAWEAAAEAMTTAHEAELAEVARVANARVATAEAQAGMAMEEQAALHFLAEVQRQEGEARAAAFTKTLDQLHKTVRLAARNAPEKRQDFLSSVRCSVDFATHRFSHLSIFFPHFFFSSSFCFSNVLMAFHFFVDRLTAPDRSEGARGCGRGGGGQEPRVHERLDGPNEGRLARRGEAVQSPRAQRGKGEVRVRRPQNRDLRRPVNLESALLRVGLFFCIILFFLLQFFVLHGCVRVWT